MDGRGVFHEYADFSTGWCCTKSDRGHIFVNSQLSTKWFDSESIHNKVALTLLRPIKFMLHIYKNVDSSTTFLNQHRHDVNLANENVLLLVWYADSDFCRSCSTQVLTFPAKEGWQNKGDMLTSSCGHTSWMEIYHHGSSKKLLFIVVDSCNFSKICSSWDLVELLYQTLYHWDHRV